MYKNDFHLVCWDENRNRCFGNLISPSLHLNKKNTKEGAVTAKGAAITIWHLKPLTNQIVSTMGTAIT